jgi:hypothetical protein
MRGRDPALRPGRCHSNRSGGVPAPSGGEQAQAKFRGVQAEQAAIAVGPPARDQVIAQAAYRALLDLGADPGPARDSAADALVQVCRWPAPVGLENAVGAVPGDRHRLDAGADRVGQVGQRGSAGPLASWVNTTTRRATRCISRSPAIGSCQ